MAVGGFKVALNSCWLRTQFFPAGVGLRVRMAVDVKSRAKRYEKLDFLGEGQVRLSWIRGILRGWRRVASPLHRIVGKVQARGPAFGGGCPDAAAAPVSTLSGPLPSELQAGTGRGLPDYISSCLEPAPRTLDSSLLKI